MPENIKIVARVRNVTGSASARRARLDGWLPCVISTPGAESKSIEMNRHGLAMILKRAGRDNLLADIEIEGQKTISALLKEIQYDAVRGDMLHADFLEISMTRKMRVAIPIRLVGDSVGVVQQGGVLEHMLRDLDVECLPGDILDFLAVDVSTLEIGQALHVSDLKVDAKLTVLSAPSGVVAAVLAPTMEKVEEPAAAAAVAADGTEPEVIGKKVEEGEAAEGAEGKDAEKGKEKGKAPAGDKAKAPEKGKAPAGDKAKGKEKEKK
ncbi:MAG: 50S ribosomal protein L25 [bacterium]